jgi:hypothetical protein
MGEIDSRRTAVKYLDKLLVLVPGGGIVEDFVEDKGGVGLEWKEYQEKEDPEPSAFV